MHKSIFTHPTSLHKYTYSYVSQTSALHERKHTHHVNTHTHTHVNTQTAHVRCGYITLFNNQFLIIFKEMECREDNEVLPYFRKTRHVSAQWKVLGVFLRVPMSRLDAIQLENHNVDSCMLAMLHAWMKQDGQHLKEKLEDALKELYSHPEKYSKPYCTLSSCS